jgi:subtilisin-like proprotein convertase family protein
MKVQPLISTALILLFSLAANAQHFGSTTPHRCSVVPSKNVKSFGEQALLANAPFPDLGINFSRGTELLELRLAVSCTGEYTQQVGGVAAAAAYIEDWIDDINDIYGREFCVRFTLIPNNNILIYPDPTTDPWPDKAPGGGCEGAPPILNVQESVIDNAIGAANYDFSHVFYSDDLSGGCAGGYKDGVSGPPDLPITRHEMGHQFGQQHTITNVGATNYELLGGSWSIMGGNNQSYAHGVTFHETANHILNVETGVGTAIPTGNTIPTVSAGLDRAIPVNTPFTLAGTASDPDAGDQITYVWDQMDAGIDQTSPVADDSQGALFMRLFPSPNAKRTFPKISDVVAGNYKTAQENLPTQAREINIRLTVNDNHKYNLNGELVNASGINSDDLKITVANTGPFTVNAPNSGIEVWNTNTNVTINWAVAGTDNAPINCNHVEIRLSVDGGITYPYLLTDNTPNDGNETLLLPEGIPQTTQARIKVECDSYENVRFFDISNNDFTVNSACQVTGHLITPVTTISGDPGESIFDLNLSPVYTAPVTEVTVSIDASDPIGKIAELDRTNNLACKEGAGLRYTTYRIQVDRTGSYNIQPRFVGGLFNGFFELYETAYDPNNSCVNFITSNSSSGPGGVAQVESLEVSLNAGTTYVLVFHPWFQDDATCNVSFSSSSGGYVYPETTQNSPSGGYSYTYLAINTATHTIAAVSSSADFTALPAGKYEVYGVSYKSSNAPPTIVDPNTFVGLTSDQAISSGCISFSTNFVTLWIAGASTCNILSLAAGAQGVCSNDTYTQAVTVTYQNPPASGTLTVNGQNFPITSSPQTVLLTGLVADGQVVDGTASFTAAPSCSRTVNGLFNAPVPCNSTGNCSTYSSTDTPITISNGAPPTTINSTITIPTAISISDVNITLQGTHTYVNDLTFTLTSPEGTSVILFGQICGGIQDFDIVLDDEATNAITCPISLGNTQQPQNPLSVFDGEEAIGNWTLRVDDDFNADGGALTSWTLEICGDGSSTCGTAPPNSGTIADGTYHTATPMTTSGEVASFSTVSLKSGVSITLTTGFHAQANATFSASIEACADANNASVIDRSIADVESASSAVNISIAPNPFYNTTTIEYELSKASTVSVEVYDLNGQRVAQLMNGEQQAAGSHQVQFDGRQQTTGIYIVMLRTAEQVQTKRLVLSR